MASPTPGTSHAETPKSEFPRRNITKNPDMDPEVPIILVDNTFCYTSDDKISSNIREWKPRRSDLSISKLFVETASFCYGENSVTSFLEDETVFKYENEKGNSVNLTSEADLQTALYRKPPVIKVKFALRIHLDLKELYCDCKNNMPENVYIAIVKDKKVQIKAEEQGGSPATPVKDEKPSHNEGDVQTRASGSGGSQEVGKPGTPVKDEKPSYDEGDVQTGASGSGGSQEVGKPGTPVKDEKPSHDEGDVQTGASGSGGSQEVGKPGTPVKDEKPSPDKGATQAVDESGGGQEAGGPAGRTSQRETSSSPRTRPSPSFQRTCENKGAEKREASSPAIPSPEKKIKRPQK